MSARPHFANPATYRPHTTFVGGINPWSQQAMPSSTAHLSASPFPASPRPGPKAGSSNRPRIDITTLKIRTDIPLPVARIVPGKYDKLFANLKPKSCIDCKPDEASPIGQALRKYLKENKKDNELVVVVAQNREDDRERGGVWAWPKAEIEEISSRVGKPDAASTGVATAAKRRDTRNQRKGTGK